MKENGNCMWMKDRGYKMYSYVICSELVLEVVFTNQVCLYIPFPLFYIHDLGCCFVVIFLISLQFRLSFMKHNKNKKNIVNFYFVRFFVLFPSDIFILRCFIVWNSKYVYTIMSATYSQIKIYLWSESIVESCK